jgi:hypothetical protein
MLVLDLESRLKCRLNRREAGGALMRLRWPITDYGDATIFMELFKSPSLGTRRSPGGARLPRLRPHLPRDTRGRSASAILI